MDDTLQHGTQPADHLQHERLSRPEQSEDGTSKPLDPALAWSIVLLVSLSLWWGLWRAISAVVSALL
jgi:hypothetical protein